MYCRAVKKLTPMQLEDLLSDGTKTKYWLVRLEVMGKKAKNATFISGTEAGKTSKEIVKVEKRRIVKSTFCNGKKFQELVHDHT